MPWQTPRVNKKAYPIEPVPYRTQPCNNACPRRSNNWHFGWITVVVIMVMDLLVDESEFHWSDIPLDFPLLCLCRGKKLALGLSVRKLLFDVVNRPVTLYRVKYLNIFCYLPYRRRNTSCHQYIYIYVALVCSDYVALDKREKRHVVTARQVFLPSYRELYGTGPRDKKTTRRSSKESNSNVRTGSGIPTPTASLSLMGFLKATCFTKQATHGVPPPKGLRLCKALVST